MAFSDILNLFQFQSHAVVALAMVIVNVLICREALMVRTSRTPLAKLSRIVQILERRYNRPELSPSMRRTDGVSTALVLIFLAIIIGVLMEWLAHSIPFVWIAVALGGSTLLSLRSVIDQVAVLSHTFDRELEEGRATLALISARDPSALDWSGISRVGIEYLARSFSTNVIAPLFYFMVLGLPGLVAFKIINVASAMVDESEIISVQFGWAPQQVNRALLWLPTRISAMLIIAAAVFVRRAQARSALRVMLGDGAKYFRLSAGWPVAAFAGALGVKLGGPATYYRLSITGGWVNQACNNPQRDDLLAALKLYRAAAIFTIFSLLLAVFNQ